MTMYDRLIRLLREVRHKDTDSSTWTIVMDGDLSRIEFLADRNIAPMLNFRSGATMTLFGLPVRFEWLMLAQPDMSATASQVERCPRLLAVEYKTRAGRTMYLDDDLTDPVWKGDK